MTGRALSGTAHSGLPERTPGVFEILGPDGIGKIAVIDHPEADEHASEPEVAPERGALLLDDLCAPCALCGAGGWMNG